ncbi:sugar kinase [Yoonia sp.]|uniref:sugar kinase n=1 Tax=Yoonia sp. TaxID=2212373 RepID=UPI0023A2D8DE|nr:sugar kinase [Yoonia sp.]MDE0850329.1 sugar kinase [Yoonia sp.]
MKAQTKRIVSIGECMVEMAPNGAPGSFGASFAGDTFNTAWYLAQLRPDWTVDYVTCIGTDTISDQMCAFMENSGVGTDHIGRLVDHTVGLYMVHLDQGERSFGYWRGQSAARQLMQQDGLVALAVTGADVIYVSGISIAILDEVGRTALRDTLMVARTNGAKIAFDPNLRPRLWVNTAAMCAAVMEFAAISDIVFPSHDEEAIYFGDANIAATKARYQNAGCTTIIVKNGGGEITFHADGHAGVFTPEMAKTVRDTTAAGDSFNAGFLASDGDAAKRIAAGCALAGRVIQGAGALVTGAAHAI